MKPRNRCQCGAFTSRDPLTGQTYCARCDRKWRRAAGEARRQAEAERVLAEGRELTDMQKWRLGLKEDKG